MKCQNCGAELEEGVLFCRECGAKVSKPKRFCRECGAQLPDVVKFCPECGAKVIDIEADFNRDSFVSHRDDYSSYPQQSTKPKTSGGTTGFSNVDQQMKRNFKQSFANKNKKAPNKKFPLLLLAAIALVLILVLAMGKGGSSDNPSSSENSGKTDSLITNSAFDVIVPEVSDSAVLDAGTEYAYMSDAWNVYIAKAVSDSVVKVESWYKGSQSDKKLKYRGDLGSFRIQDVENGFSWVDESHTAFTLVIQDKNNSEVRKPTLVIFTINISDSDKYKGTDYDDSIACYTYVNDDWHTYRAIPLTDTLIKVECWYRTSAGTFDKHCFGWDVGVIDTEKTATDFEWGGANRGAFTITMRDPANKSYWKDSQLTSFILENEKYKYATVKDYLNGIKVGDKGKTESVITESVEKSNEKEVRSDETEKETSTEALETGNDPETTEAPEAVSYSTNTEDTVKDGNKGVYSYKSRGGTYDNYYIIDFDEGYVYFFSDGNEDTNCDRLKIDYGDLNDGLTITYHDGSDVWSYGLHFKWKNQPDHLIMQDNDGFEYDFYSTDLSKALGIKNQKTIHDY